MAFVIRQRLKELGLEQSDPTAAFPQEEFRKPKLGKPSFNPYEEAFGFVDFLSAGLTRRCNVLCGEGVTLSVFDRGGRKCLRVVLNGETRYSLEVWMGGNVGDSSLGFYGLPGESNWSSGSTNAWAKMVWDRDHQSVVLDFTDLSLLGHLSETRRYTYEQFLDALWVKICGALETFGTFP